MIPSAPTSEGARKLWYSGPHPVTGAPQIPRPVSIIERLRNPMPDDLRLAWTVAAAIAVLAFVLRVIDVTNPPKLMFDETYYAKDAFAFLQAGHELNWSEGANDQALAGDFRGLQDTGSFIAHPPIGKWMIALGIAAFGFTPYGFRIPAVIAGSLLVFVITMLTRRLSRSTLVGATAGLLLTLDGLHFVMSRIALLDIFQALFGVAAVACLVADRDWFRNRLANHLEKHELRDLGGTYGPLVWWRPWQLAAGVLFGLACATKWSSVYLLATFAVVSVLWELGARRLAGAGKSSWLSLIRDAPIAFVYQAILPVVVYVTSWSGWLATSGGYGRDFGINNPDDPVVRVLGPGLGGLWAYHKAIFEFHTGQGIKDATHVYEAHPAGWLVMARPTGVDANTGIQPGIAGCPPGGQDCVSVISAMGTPVLWWFGVLALLASIVWWIGTRDWRFSVPVLGVAATWLTWFPNADRPIFFFYAITIIPFTCIAIALCLGKLLGPANSGRRRQVGAIISGVIVALVALNFAYIYPLLTDGLLTLPEWQMRMWFRSWI